MSSYYLLSIDVAGTINETHAHDVSICVQLMKALIVETSCACLPFVVSCKVCHTGWRSHQVITRAYILAPIYIIFHLVCLPSLFDNYNAYTLLCALLGQAQVSWLWGVHISEVDPHFSAYIWNSMHCLLSKSVLKVACLLKRFHCSAYTHAPPIQV